MLVGCLSSLEKYVFRSFSHSFYFKMYLFGCVRSYLQCVGSSLSHVGLRASLALLWHVGSQFPDQGPNVSFALSGVFLTTGPPAKSLF